MSKKIYGLSRSRDKHGNIVKRNLNDVVNCIHTNAGSGYKTMEILIVDDAEYIAPALSTMGGGNQQPIIVEMIRTAYIIQCPHGFNKGGFHSISPALT